MQPNNTTGFNSNIFNATDSNSSSDDASTSQAETSTPSTPVQTTTPMNPSKDVVFKNKSHKGHLIGMTVLAAIAAGAIGFSVWAMLSWNQDKTFLNDKVNSLSSELTQKDNKIAELEENVRELISQTGQNGEGEATGVVTIKEIGACVADSGTAQGGATIIKCEATTANGTGQFVYDSTSNQLQFIPAETQTTDETTEATTE